MKLLLPFVLSLASFAGDRRAVPEGIAIGSPEQIVAAVRTDIGA